MKNIIFIFIILLSLFIIKTINDAGEFKKLTPHYNGNCVSVFGLDGPEDITILKDGLAFISSNHRWKTLANNPVQGHIYSYDLNMETPELINLTSNLKIEFHPHGISVFEDSLNNVHLFVVNHVDENHSIEVFKYENNQLIHNKTIKDPMLISPNDLVLISNNQFYVTNDHGTTSNFIKTVQDYLQLSNSNVMFYDNQQFKVVINDVKYANGINISPNKELVYVAETIGKKISIYLRNSTSNELDFIESIYMNSGVDNIEIDNNGNLWIGSHPKMLAFTRHAKDKINLSPSQVLRVSLDSTNQYYYDEIYLNEGKELSGSSVGTIYKNNFLIGAVLTDHFLHCKLKL